MPLTKIWSEIGLVFLLVFNRPIFGKKSPVEQFVQFCLDSDPRFLTVGLIYSKETFPFFKPASLDLDLEQCFVLCLNFSIRKVGRFLNHEIMSVL